MQGCSGGLKSKGAPVGWRWTSSGAWKRRNGGYKSLPGLPPNPSLPTSRSSTGGRPPGTRGGPRTSRRAFPTAARTGGAQPQADRDPTRRSTPPGKGAHGSPQHRRRLMTAEVDKLPRQDGRRGKEHRVRDWTSQAVNAEREEIARDVGPASHRPKRLQQH